MGKFDREKCIQLIKEKYAEIGERFPKRSDFSEEEVVAIKAFLGPWPRALEAAGLKERKAISTLEKNRERRLRAKEHRERNKKE